MERCSDKAVEILNDLHTERLDYSSEYVPLIDCAQKCAAYENTGLEPEEIVDLRRSWDMYGGEDGINKIIAELQRKEPPNAPLTLEELREMGIREWLWIELIRPTKRMLFIGTKSAYYQIFEDYTDGEALCCGWPGTIHEFEYEDYGKAWLAYRRKPEEGTK